MASYSLNSSGIDASHNSSILSIGSAGTLSPQVPRFGTLIPGRVFICGIPPGTTEAELRAHFESYGQIKDVKVIKDYNGTSRGYGFVTFEHEEDSQRVLDAAKDSPDNGLEFKSRKLSVGPAIKRQGGAVKQPVLGNAFPSGVSIIYGPNGVPYLFYNGVTYLPQDLVPAVPQTPYPVVVPQPTTIYVPAGPTQQHIAQSFAQQKALQVQDHYHANGVYSMGNPGGCGVVAQGPQLTVSAQVQSAQPQYRTVSHVPACAYQVTMPYGSDQSCGMQGHAQQNTNAVTTTEQQQYSEVMSNAMDLERNRGGVQTMGMQMQNTANSSPASQIQSSWNVQELQQHHPNNMSPHMSLAYGNTTTGGAGTSGNPPVADPVLQGAVPSGLPLFCGLPYAQAQLDYPPHATFTGMIPPNPIYNINYTPVPFYPGAYAGIPFYQSPVLLTAKTGSDSGVVLNSPEQKSKEDVKLKQKQNSPKRSNSSSSSPPACPSMPNTPLATPEMSRLSVSISQQSPNVGNPEMVKNVAAAPKTSSPVQSPMSSRPPIGRRNARRALGDVSNAWAQNNNNYNNAKRTGNGDVNKKMPPRNGRKVAHADDKDAPGAYRPHLPDKGAYDVSVLEGVPLVRKSWSLPASPVQVNVALFKNTTANYANHTTVYTNAQQARNWQRSVSNTGSSGPVLHLQQSKCGGGGSPCKQWQYATVAAAGTTTTNNLSPTRYAAIPAPRMHSTPQVFQHQRTNSISGYQNTTATRYYAKSQQHISVMPSGEAHGNHVIGSPPKNSVAQQLDYKA